MLSLREVLAGVGLYVGLLVTAAFVLNLRYKPMAGDYAYLDTWTGKIRPSAAVPLAMAQAALNAPQGTETTAASVRRRRRREEGCVRVEVMRASESLARARAGLERDRRALREYRREFLRVRRGQNEYTDIRFAFPAPEVRVDW